LAKIDNEIVLILVWVEFRLWAEVTPEEVFSVGQS